MVCVGSVGIDHFAQGRIGSTAAALARSAQCSVAILRGHNGTTRSDDDWIVVEVDESPESAAVLQTAVEEALLRGAPLHVLTAWRSRFSDIHDRRAVTDGNL